MDNCKNLIFFFPLVTLLFFSCKKDDKNAFELNAEVTVNNTLQTAADPSMGGTGGVETSIETIFGLPTGTFELTTNIDEGIEFADYLDGLYDINISETQITYNLVAPADHQVYSNFYRTIEANTFDRYYFEFTEAHNIDSFISNNSSVNLRIDSDKIIVVEIGEGFNFNPGTSFTIDFN